MPFAYAKLAEAGKRRASPEPADLTRRAGQLWGRRDIGPPNPERGRTC
jgi:hypothetical protein